jgi:predicted SPOUT superfamily RNA methylase MTH1
MVFEEEKNSQNKTFKFIDLRKILPIFVIEELIYDFSKKSRSNHVT